MLTHEQNERLTQVGPGTPCGELLRRYWQALCPTAEITGEQPQEARPHPRRGSGRLPRRRRGATAASRSAARTAAPRSTSASSSPTASAAATTAGSSTATPARASSGRSRPQPPHDGIRVATYPVQRSAGCSSSTWGPIRKARRCCRAGTCSHATDRPQEDPGHAGPSVQLAADPGEHRRLRAHLLPARPQRDGRGRSARAAPATYFYRPIVGYDWSRLRVGDREDARVRRRAAGDRGPAAADLPEHLAHPRRPGRSAALPRPDRRRAHAHHLDRDCCRPRARLGPSRRSTSRSSTSSIRRTTTLEDVDSDRRSTVRTASCGRRRARRRPHARDARRDRPRDRPLPAACWPSRSTASSAARSRTSPSCAIRPGTRASTFRRRPSIRAGQSSSRARSGIAKKRRSGSGALRTASTA